MEGWQDKRINAALLEAYYLSRCSDVSHMTKTQQHPSRSYLTTPQKVFSNFKDRLLLNGQSKEVQDKIISAEMFFWREEIA